MGNGASIKSGARHAHGDLIVFMDADGQHNPKDVRLLIEKLLNEHYDMVVGARELSTHSSYSKRVGNWFYNRLASIMTGHYYSRPYIRVQSCKSRYFQKISLSATEWFFIPDNQYYGFLSFGTPRWLYLYSCRNTSKRNSQ